MLDRFELRKSRGRLSPEYMAQTYPEKALGFFHDAIPSLNGRAAAVPGTNAPAKVLFNIVTMLVGTAFEFLGTNGHML